MMRCLLLALMALLFARPVLAHEALPLVISVTEHPGNAYAVRVRQPPAIAWQSPPEVILPNSCKTIKASALRNCDSALGGGMISWTYAGLPPSIPTIVRTQWLSGEVQTIMAPPGTSQVEIPKSETAARVSLQFFRLGVEHILTGFDHLLFLACLLWIAGSFRRIFLTVTGFTLAHSLTLALSALAIVRVPSPPTEAAIALSILFLAREIAVGKRDDLVWRHPVAVSSLFGLLHGLGFASALREVGLPQTQLLAGLLSFNLGVEAGQLAAIFLAVGVVGMARRIIDYGRKSPSILRFAKISDRVPALALTAIGGISAFWLTERVVGFF